MFVKNKMTANPFTVSPDQTVPEALELMEKHGIKRLPVLKNGKLIGVVSKGDIDRASPSKATTFSAGEISYLLAKIKISQVMSKDPKTIPSDALLEEAALLLREFDVGFLPVVDDGKLVGIITESNIFDAFIELLGFREHGTRLTVEMDDIPGMMAILTSIFASFGANITHIAIYRGTIGKSAVVIGVNALNTEGIEKLLEEKGFKILYKLQNK